jgi:general secretion pathway protein G
MNRNTPPTGFTLIELLVVVAIIAILAAIAVPNFLEAQTRAKVSRVHADIRTLVTAVESYRVDNRAYLPHNDTPQDMAPLTTPVAFITSLPRDPFNSRRNPNWHLTGGGYQWEDLADIYFVLMPSWGGGTWLRDQIAAHHVYSLSSPGPDRVGTMAFDASAQYDPTNGTTSRGDIYRLGP